ncbi:hypothetical protein RB195_012083 [Necator americanus]|uniref:Uncharacterized protein n=1 Tax=Necator americanus TaxID=51031 RepID=A0ABR1D6E1_NECAM
MVCRNEELYAEADMVYRRMTRGKRQHLSRPSETVMENRLRFFSRLMRKPLDRFVQVVLRMLPDPTWERLPGRKREFCTEVVE